MKKFWLAIISITLITSSAFAQRSTITKFKGEDIYGLIIDGNFEVKITKGDDTQIVVDVPDDLANKLTIFKNESNIVQLKFGSTVGNVFVSSKNKPKVKITLNRLDMLNVDGSVTLLSSGTFPSSNFELTVGGSSTAEFIKVDCQSAVCRFTGTSKTSNCTINSQGKVSIDSNNAAHATIAGSAPEVKLVAGVTSLLDVLMFDCPTIEAITSGTAVIKANVSGTANLIKSGLSAFKYIGDGVVKGDKASKL